MSERKRDEPDSIRQIPKAGALYFSVVFGAGFVLRTIRTLWVVPSFGARRAELLPHTAKDPGYLAKNSYELVDNAGTVVGSGTVSEEMNRQLRSGKLGVRQTPGPNNALGLLKFDFPNQHDVYMHGTRRHGAVLTIST